MTLYKKIIDGIPVVKKREKIVIKKGRLNVYNPTEEMLLADGWVEYVMDTEESESDHSKDSYTIMQEIIFEQYNSRTDIADKEALDRALVIYDWDYYIGKSLQAGQVVVHDGSVYRVRQDIAQVLDVYPPSIDTAALYEVIVMTATGEKDDPIAYTPPMEVFSGKYYTQDDELYLCTRDSGTALSHDLKDLVGIYVNKL